MRVRQHQGGTFRSPFRPPVLSDCVVEKPDDESFRRFGGVEVKEPVDDIVPQSLRSLAFFLERELAHPQPTQDRKWNNGDRLSRGDLQAGVRNRTLPLVVVFSLGGLLTWLDSCGHLGDSAHYASAAKGNRGRHCAPAVFLRNIQVCGHDNKSTSTHRHVCT